MRAYLLPATLLLAACPGDDQTAIDGDGDGFTDVYDCNDSDPNIGSAIDFFLDADEDGYGNPQFSASGCVQPEGFVDNPGDCDDLDSAFNPAAAEDDCDDPTDYNCDGKSGFVDEDNDGFAACEDCDDDDADLNPDTSWFRDRDEDGYGNPDAEIKDCNPPTGWVRDNTDCNDFDNEIHEEQKWFKDADEDQYGDPGSFIIDCRAPFGHVSNSDDCDDSDAETNPKKEWFEDADEDGYGNPESIGRACVQPSGYVENPDDCDDSTKGVAPGKLELCDGVDNDCDTVIDDGAPVEKWYGDDDEDGWGDTRYMVENCAEVPGFVRREGDCDDTDPAINPNAVDQLCDGVDRGCDFEAGLVSWTPVAGTPVDVSADFATGTEDAPFVWSAPEDGELLVCGGTFAARLVIDGFDVDVTGPYADGATTISGGLDGSVIEVIDGLATVQGITFADGFATGGGAVRVENSDVSFSYCSLVDSLAADGGALWLDASSTANFTGVIVEGNSATADGGGLYVAGDLVSDEGAVQGNDAADQGGAAYVTGTWGALSTDILSNSATDAAIRVVGSGLFEATTCDFGVDASPRDNTPFDIIGGTSGTTTDLGDAATRLCDDATCI